jgi:hypothetical protein
MQQHAEQRDPVPHLGERNYFLFAAGWRLALGTLMLGSSLLAAAGAGPGTQTIDLGAPESYPHAAADPLDD